MVEKTRNSPKGYWEDKEKVLKEARKYKYKSEFRHKAPSAYKSALLHHWLGEMEFETKVSKGDPRGPIHIIYVYIDEVNKYAYVGATNDMKRRDWEHKNQKNDPVYKYFYGKSLKIPAYKILLDGLTIVERQREERVQSLYYRDVLHYTLINNINLTGENVGSVGSLIKKWTKKAVLREAEKYKTPTEFFAKSAGAYDAALKYKMMNNETFPWFYSKRMPPRWWSVKEHVFEESKNYKSWNEFFLKSPAAHFSARKHKWEDEMTWLLRDQVPQGYWQNEEHVIEESKKYSTRTDFFKGCHAAYDYAAKNNLWEKMPWIKTKVKEHGYWTKERVFEEGGKYSTKMEFKRGAPTAYSLATKNNWINEMEWAASDAKPQGFWQNKQNVIAESHKYSSRSEFRWGTPSAYRSAIDNGWIDEMKWLKRPQNYNLKWTRENVFIESHKYDSRGAFKKGCPSAYRVANVNGWMVEMIWLNIKNKNKIDMNDINFDITKHWLPVGEKQGSIEKDTLRIKVSGINFHTKPEANFWGVFTGCIKTEPNNPYDINAIGFYKTDGQLLGFVQKELQDYVNKFSKGKELDCVIAITPFISKDGKVRNQAYATILKFLRMM